jgi:UDP-glucuronate decarboxylase
MRSLVTGGAGFLGMHLCRKLLGCGHEVICLDNLSTSQKISIQGLLSNPKFEFIRHDITEPIMLEIDEIYNLACPASPPQYQSNPVKTIKTSVLGMINVLELARRCGAKVFQASTSEVYGDPDVSPQSEGYLGLVNTIGPRACYDEGKRLCETLMMEYHNQYNVDTRIARIFNTYGPGMHPYDGRVVSNFIVQALRGEPLTVYGDGLQTRSFCFVDDLIRGIELLMQSYYVLPVNLGNPTEISMLDLIATIQNRMLGLQIKVKHLPLPINDPKQRCPDISIAKSLGWDPMISLADGLSRTINWFERLDMPQYRRLT